MKRKSIALIAFISATMILSSCGSSENQEDSLAKKNEIEINETEEITADEQSSEEMLWSGYIMDFTDLDSMGESFRIDWESQLEETVYSYGGCRSSAQGYMDSPKNSDEERDFPFYFYTLDEFSIPTFYKTTAYGYIADGTAYIMSQTKESFEEIKYAGQAEELAEIMSDMFIYEICLADYKEDDGNLATIISGLGLADGRMFDGKVDLSTPETAIAQLLHYSGGTAESVPWEIYGNSRIVTYTFTDGSSISWNMAQDYEDSASNGMGDFWFPFGYCYEETLLRAKKIQKYMTGVSVDSLKEITNEPDFNSSEWMTLPENEDKDMFVLLYEADKDDIALYGLYGGEGVILRDGSDVYPIYTTWMGPQSIWPTVKKADYDNDGTKEYALWMVLGTGTGFHHDGLFMLEPDAEQETGLRVNQLTTEDMMYQFDVIDYTFNEEKNILKVDTGSGSVEMDLTKYLEEQEEEYTGLGWGDLIFVEEKDGQWYITMSAGVTLSNYVQPQYECGMDFTAPVTYMENGYFQVGDISIENVTYGV